VKTVPVTGHFPASLPHGSDLSRDPDPGRWPEVEVQVGKGAHPDPAEVVLVLEETITGRHQGRSHEARNADTEVPELTAGLRTKVVVTAEEVVTANMDTAAISIVEAAEDTVAVEIMAADALIVDAHIPAIVKILLLADAWASLG